MKLLLLRLALLVRCAVNVAFACYLVAAHPASISALARAFMPYAAADGVLALLLAVLVIWTGWHAGIAMVAFIDGLIRAFSALVLWFGPGTPDFPVTAVLYIATLATLGFSLGVLELGEARRLRREVGRNPVSVALVVAGSATIVLAVFAFFTTPGGELARHLLVVAAVIEAAALLGTMIGAGRPLPNGL
jgi:hypothetical protein